jgi:hypothetical protein
MLNIFLESRKGVSCKVQCRPIQLLQFVSNVYLRAPILNLVHIIWNKVKIPHVEEHTIMTSLKLEFEAEPYNRQTVKKN